MNKAQKLTYFDASSKITIPSPFKTFLSRLAFPVLALSSREASLKMGLTPIDDERVIMALKETSGHLLDIGCGANIFVKSYGDGVGVDVANWDGVDVVLEDAAILPFPTESFDTVSYLACLNHVKNRDDSLKAAYKVLKPGGIIVITMITPKMGAFIHWLRERNDPDQKERHIEHSHELMGMSPKQVSDSLQQAGFKAMKRKRFVYGLNSIYVAVK